MTHQNVSVCRINAAISDYCYILLTNKLKCVRCFHGIITKRRNRGNDSNFDKSHRRQPQQTRKQRCGPDSILGWLNLRWSLSCSCLSELAYLPAILGGGM